MGEPIVTLVDQYGLLIVFVTVLLGQAGVPIPAIGILIGAGAIVADGGSSAPAILVAAVGACLVADTILFAVGRRYGRSVLITIERLTKLPNVSVRALQARFNRWGASSLVVAKFIPGWTTIAPPLAGALGTSWPRFLVLSAVGAVLWAGVGIALGCVFAAQIPQIIAHLRAVGLVTAVALIILVGLGAALGWRKRRRALLSVRTTRLAPDSPMVYQSIGSAP